MDCISRFLEVMDHEMPQHSALTSSRSGYKVDGEGIKKHCLLSGLKSVDYFEINSERGFLYVEFSDLFAHDVQIQYKILQISDSNLSPKIKKDLRKQFNKEIANELKQKAKDSRVIQLALPEKLANLPEKFNDKALYVVVVPPIEEANKVEQARFIDDLKSKLTCSVPDTIAKSVIVVPLNHFLAS
ncbi:hypothetical protein CW745_14055 [Psychromonas sp. psych-6C06]|uniref:hypothetical protein n=1 Tax=Psychromonas sp. psych-6C06 TaxID=2058089 RepID=UPI000C31FBF1|nr:hypothetical protein [Psychromonas sp. psych-6C06]PKF60650.1 hypothetical protein CW745_14055 [Psychromonas sp. psych-6C06]